MNSIRKLLLRLRDLARDGAETPAVALWAARNGGHTADPREVADNVLKAMGHFRAARPEPDVECIPAAIDVLNQTVPADADDCAVAFTAALLSLGITKIQLVAEAYDREENFCHVVVEVMDRGKWLRYDPTYGCGPEMNAENPRIRGRIEVPI